MSSLFRAGPTIAVLGAAAAVLVLGAPSAWASGTVVVTPDPVVVSQTAPVEATMSVTVEAAAPLPAGIDSVTVALDPASGGVSFTTATAGCRIGPSTAIVCPWVPAVAGERLTVTATILVAPGVPAQEVPLHWTVSSTLSQQPVDEGGGTVSLVTSLPTPSSTPTRSPTPRPTSSRDGNAGTEVPVPTAVPAGEGPADSSPAWAPWVLAVLGSTVAVLAVTRGRARRGRRG